MIRRLVIFTAVVLVFGVAAASAQARIRFSFVQYNPPGADTGSNTSRNAEYVTLYNPGATGKVITGWRILDNQGHVYKFKTYTLCSHCKVTVHTGNGSDTRRHKYWGSSAYIWNNTGDRARLKKPGNILVDSCSWGAGDGTTTCS